MFRTNGGLIGKYRSPTIGAAPGIWSPAEQIAAKQGDFWVSNNPDFVKISFNGLILTDVSADGLTFYAGKAAVGIATTEPFWSIRRTLFSSSGLVTSTGIARDIAWINRNTGFYT